MTHFFKTAVLLSFLYLSTIVTWGQSNQWFCDSTLRLDYILAGTSETQSIYLNRIKAFSGWYGRHTNMNQLLLRGNGILTVTDFSGRDTLYMHSFSTLFQEWQSTEEATKVARSFEHSVLIPMPKEQVQITVELYNMHNGSKSFLKHIVNPNDRLIARHRSSDTMPYRYLRQSGDSRDKIDVVFVPEGYTTDEMETFIHHCEESMNAILSHAPFTDHAQKFNFLAVEVPSEDSGVSIPGQGKWRNTAVGSHFDTFYSARYLTTPNITKLFDILDGIPCESIIIIANSEQYGGGGIYNSYMLSSSNGESNSSVIVHEFGHSFAGLADEYYYDDQYETYYPSHIEPWEQNITTLVNFQAKWEDMLSSDTPIPSPADGKDIYCKIGVYEGGGYQSKGVYRPAQDCRMKTNAAPAFCPVCQRAIGRLIQELCAE